MYLKNFVSAERFAAEFRDVIRIGLNWDRFLEERWPVEIVTIRAFADLGCFLMPWYIGKKGQEVAYDYPDAVPMRLTDIPKAMEILNSERQADILKYVEEFRNHNGITEVTVPTYAMPNEQYFVLDGNHRLSALALNAVPFEVTLWNIHGPFDSTGLLDLIHWDIENRGTG